MFGSNEVSYAVGTKDGGIDQMLKQEIKDALKLIVESGTTLAVVYCDVSDVRIQRFSTVDNITIDDHGHCFIYASKTPHSTTRGR